MPSELCDAGPLVLVVGPSGAGKDSLIDAVRPALSANDRLVFARRCITRASDSGGEDHESVTMEQFQTRRKMAGFLLHWQAYGMFYGIPARYREDLAAGRVVVANVSRMVLNEARREFSPLSIVHVTASPEILAARLGDRGRETQDAVAMRLRRAVATIPSGDDVVTISNDGALQSAAAQFEYILLRLAAGTSRLASLTQESTDHETPAY